MTVKELYNWCKACRHKEAKVYLVKDWEQVDEDGWQTDLYELEDVNMQTIVVDAGLDFVEVHEALLTVSEKRAGSE